MPPRLMLDTNVLYPTVLREVLLAAARAGFMAPLWSARILEEWRRVALRLGPAGAAVAEGEIALLRAHWPAAEVSPPEGLAARLWLPDPQDVHVLAAAIAGSAERIVTFNARDFPRRILAAEGLGRVDPDTLLMEFLAADARRLEAAVAPVQMEAERLAGAPVSMRRLLRKAGLPRLARALGRP